MKKSILISCACMLLATSISVTLAAQERVSENVPKKEAPAFMHSEPYVVTAITSGDDLLAYQYPALLTDDILIPAGTIEYLEQKKVVLSSPDIDRKWVWWYSIITNS